MSLAHERLLELSQQMERLWNEWHLLRFPAPIQAGVFAPAADVLETGEEILVRLELPGVEPGSLTIGLVEGRLRVAGTRGDPSSQGMTRFHHKEIDFGAFVRCVPLPLAVEFTSLQAAMEDGFLVIRLRKRQGDQP